jgi:hypothetical protein
MPVCTGVQQRCCTLLHQATHRGFFPLGCTGNSNNNINNNTGDHPKPPKLALHGRDRRSQQRPGRQAAALCPSPPHRTHHKRRPVPLRCPQLLQLGQLLLHRQRRLISRGIPAGRRLLGRGFAGVRQALPLLKHVLQAAAARWQL